MNGGQRIRDYAAHPGLIGAGGTTTATGRYQFVKGTWERAATALRLTDFSQASQDRAAAWLAQADYRTNTGRDLARDIADGNYAAIRAGLKTT
jgi:muramidase (phage lysozyme)